MVKCFCLQHRCERGVVIFPLCYMLLPLSRRGQAKIFWYMSFFGQNFLLLHIFSAFCSFFSPHKIFFTGSKIIPVLRYICADGARNFFVGCTKSENK